jgi:hypothetical protein
MVCITPDCMNTGHLIHQFVLDFFGNGTIGSMEVE